MEAETQLAFPWSWSPKLEQGHVLAMLGGRLESCTALACVQLKSSLVQNQDR